MPKGYAPILPVAPRDYDYRYMDALIKALNYFISEVRNPGPMRGTELTLTALVDAADDTAAETAGVPVGGIYHNAGELRIRLT